MKNAGKVWTDVEHQQLREEFAAGMTLEQMMASHGRSAYGITSKLVHLGLVVQHGYGLHRIDVNPWITQQQVNWIARGVAP